MPIIRVSPEEIVAMLDTVFQRAGLSAVDARIVIDALLDAELTNRKGHGLGRVPGIAARAEGAGSDCIELVRDEGGVVALDCHGALGYLAAHRASCIVREKLATFPAVNVACRRTSHAGAIGYYARLAAEDGHCALAAAHCYPMVVPHGGHDAVYGTNPIALACPGPDHVLLADLSPAATTYGAIMNARHGGGALPEGVALDGEGRPTSDPDRALDGGIVPVGGAKGSALAFLVQVLSGALTGAAGVPEKGKNYGFFLAGYRLDAFAEADAVRAELGRLVDAVHAAGAQCPGDRSQAHRLRVKEEGIGVDAKLWDTIQGLAD